MRMKTGHVTFVGIMLALIALAACQTVTEESSEQPSEPATTDVVWIETGVGTSPLHGRQVNWFDATATPNQIKFACAHNRYLERQFGVEIVDDIDGNIANPGCRTLTPASDTLSPKLPQAGENSVLWLVTPYFAKIHRQVEYVFSQPNVIDKVAVHSRPIIRVNVLVIDRRTHFCAAGEVHATAHGTRFELEPDAVPDTNGVGSMRHDTEGYRLQIKLSEIHGRASSTLAAAQPTDCDELIGRLLKAGGIDRFQAGLISSPLQVFESGYLPIQSSTPEMGSVVRIRVCRDPDCSDYGYGSGFYIEDEGSQVSGPDTSTLILTNHHVVGNAEGGMVRVSTLQHENVVHALRSEGLGQLYHDYFPGTVVFHDERRDLALVRVSQLNSGTPLKLHRQDLPSSDDYQVMALGHPKGATYYTTRGSISRIVSNCASGGASRFEKSPVKCIQHDAPINSGNSGGPLLSVINDQGGLVLGVNVRATSLSWAYIANVLDPTLTKQELRDIEARLPTIPYPGLSTAIHYEEVQMFLNEFFEASLPESGAR